MSLESQTIVFSSLLQRTFKIIYFDGQIICESFGKHFRSKKKDVCRVKFVSETLDLRKYVLLTKKPALGSCESKTAKVKLRK